MKKHLNLKLWSVLATFAAMMLWSTTVNAAVPEHWKESGFSIDARGMSLEKVINEFAEAYGVRASFRAKNGAPLRGRLTGESGADFLDRLAKTYRLRWFVYNDTLYVVPNTDNVSVRLEVGEDAVQDAKAALIGLGLYDKRFGWGELPDEGVVMVSGPRAYVDLARDLLMPKDGKTARGKQMMVFRLKYANAADRVIQVRGEKETVPGVQTILTRLLNADSRSSVEENDHHSFDVTSSKRSRTSNLGRGEAREAESESGLLRSKTGTDGDRTKRGQEATKKSGPRISADTTLNAVIIYDDASRRRMYESLIADLDVQPKQIEIEALIVDIDRTKLSELGVEWGMRRGETVTRVNGTGNDSEGVSLPIPGSTLLISNAARFYTRLRALEGAGEAEVRAKPTVLTLDNVAAILDLSQTTYLPLVGERVADLANVSAGTMLRVVPRLVEEDGTTRVRLEIDIEDGKLDDPESRTPVATRSTISTQAIVDLQQTLMIGGYHAESRSNSVQKVPLLGDVPLFGALFRSSAESHRNRERLFLITPRLTGVTGPKSVTEPAPPAGGTEDAPAEEARASKSVDKKDFVGPSEAKGMDSTTRPASAGRTLAPEPSVAPLRSFKLTCARPSVGFRLSSRL